MYIFEEAEKKGYGVEKFQVVQLNLQTILIEIVHSVMYNKVKFENLLVDYISKNLGEDVDVNFETVDDILREKSGKLRWIVGIKDNNASS